MPGGLRMLALALTVSPLSARAGSPFDDCKISAPRPDDRAIQCKGILASISYGPTNLGADALLEAAIGGVRAGFKGTITSEPTVLALATRKVSGIRYRAFSPRDTKKPVLVGRLFAAVDAVDPTRIRIIGCGAATAHPTGESTCDGMLASLHDRIPVATSEALPPVPDQALDKIAGRTVDAPKGCELIEPRRIRCADAEIHWRALAKTDPEGLDWVAAPLATAFAKLGKVATKDAGCTIEGSPGMCRAITVTRADGKSIYVTVGTGSARGERVMVQCNSNVPFAKTMPAPCDAVLK